MLSCPREASTWAGADPGASGESHGTAGSVRQRGGRIPRGANTERGWEGAGLKFQIGSFDRYFVSASETEEELLESASPFVAALRSYHGFFVKHVFADQEEMSVARCLLAMHAFMIYMGALRVAFSGHTAATFPLLRTALESACYAFLIGENAALERIWLNRNSSDEALRLCKREFTPAVRRTANALQDKSWIAPVTEDWINELYDAAIDFGAHPNAKSILPYLEVDENRGDGHVAVSLTSLYGPEAHSTSRGLVACLDHGLAIAVILASCVDSPSKAAIASINEMNELKERLVADYESR